MQPTQTDPTKLHTQATNGANWFLWIAALSLLNAIFVLFGGRWSFPIGLGITQLISGVAVLVATDLVTTGLILVGIIAMLMNVFFAGIFVGCGLLARKYYVWAYIIGMLLYTMDALLTLGLEDYAGAAFHLFALWLLFSGAKAAAKLRHSITGAAQT